MRGIVFRLIGGLAGLLLLSVAHGSTTYSYVGPNYTFIEDEEPFPSGTFTTAMGITGSFTVATPLGPMPLTNLKGLDGFEFTFSNGRSTLTDTTADLRIVEAAVDGSGAITEWNIQLERSFPPQTKIGDQMFRIDNINFGGLQINTGRITECRNVDTEKNVCLGGGRVDQGQITDTAGAWSVVPIPPAVWLLGSGLLGLIAIARR